MAADSGVACFGTVDSWIIYKLTGGAGKGVHVTDGERCLHRIARLSLLRSQFSLIFSNSLFFPPS